MASKKNLVCENRFRFLLIFMNELEMESSGVEGNWLKSREVISGQANSSEVILGQVNSRK